MAALTLDAAPRRTLPLAALAGTAAFALLVLVLLGGAIVNGFPLVFPDSGTYLGIAFGPEYAIDRSSYYGLMLKPLVELGGNTDARGLWIAITVQAALVAAAIAAVVRTLAPEVARVLLLVAVLAPFTALPWHAGQYMPDAFTGPLVLVTWLAARRDPARPGGLLLWIAAAALATLHYTHIILFAVTAGTTILIEGGARVRRVAQAAIAGGLAVAALVGANGIALQRWTMSPVGPAFLFARLNEDGLIPRWLDAHCGTDAPAALCAERADIPWDSQKLLWGESIVAKHIWRGDDVTRWKWVEMMAAANRGAIIEQPTAFIAAAARGAIQQFTTFAVLDDECPANCRSTVSGIGFTLDRYRPATVAMLHGSAQGEGTLPKAMLRAVTTPIAAIALMLLPILGVRAWRRKDTAIASLCAAVLFALAANAAMAGALSDVHDRYQSRLIWLAPLVLLLIWVRRERPAA